MKLAATAFTLQIFPELYLVVKKNKILKKVTWQHEVTKTRDGDYMSLCHRGCDGETDDNHTMNSDDRVLGLGCSMYK